MPATKGMQVRMMGMKRDRATARPPWRRKNSSVRRRYCTLQQAIAAAEGGRTHQPAHRVVDRVAEHGGEAEHDGQKRRVERVAGIDRGQRADAEEQRVARQKRRHDESGLRENHREEDRVDPEVNADEQLDQMPVEVQYEIDQP